MYNLNSRTQYPIFLYKNFQWQFENSTKLQIEFEFEVENLVVFKPRLEINFPEVVQNNLTKDDWDQLIFHFGLVEMISYWKATCSSTIKIQCGNLIVEQIDFWKDLFYKGLGEFRFKNNIQTNKKDFVAFDCNNKINYSKIIQNNLSKPDSILTPLGGGKDSVVTIEIFRKNAILPYLFLLNPRVSTLKIAELSGVSKNKWVIAKREIDKNLLILNEKGFLNGHTPFSAMLAFMTILTSVPMGIHFISLSNENSAEEGNVNFNGETVNHQYSKSFEFEKKISRYIQNYITEQTQYFSFLRPLKELQIARLFAKYKKYHSDFRSCNVGQKKDIWCGGCSKCLFVWVILSPWLSASEMTKIFGKNIWCDLQLLETLKQLAGVVGNKPFECVGTISEVRTALAISINKYASEEFPLLVEAKKWGLEIVEEEISQEHLMPKLFMEMLQNELSS